MSSSDLFEIPLSAERAKTNAIRKRLPAWVLPATLVAAFGVLFLWFLRDRLLPSHAVSVTPVVLLTDLEQESGPAPEATEAKTDESVSADFSAPMKFQAAGWFEPDPLPIRATALTDGVIADVHVLEGETVAQGQKLASLIAEDTDLKLAASERNLEEVVAEHHMHLATIPAVEAKAESVSGQIDAAKAKLEEAEDRYKRVTSVAVGSISEHEIVSARLAVDSQKADIRALRSEHAAELAQLDAIEAQSAVFDARIAAAKVAIAEMKLARERIDIVSPVNGIVLELKATPGQKKMLAMDNPESATVAVLFETGKLQARVDVPLADAAGLVPGQPAIITSDFLPNQEFRGVVTRIVGHADLQRNTLQAKVRVIDPDPRLRPEMLCRVKFLEATTATISQSAAAVPASEGSRGLFVPLNALVDRAGSQAAAWTVSADGKRAMLKNITLGRREVDGHVAIETGLLAGELVILPPHDDLKTGRRIHHSSTTH